MTTIESPISRPAVSGLICREKGQPAAGDTPEIDTADDADAAVEKALLCRQCRSVITSGRSAISVDGNHVHAFFNPAGIIFEICCFKQAEGCAVHGEPTDEFSWFKGYVWRYALCATCLIHLGWLFDSGETSFFGLIDNKLVKG